MSFLGNSFFNKFSLHNRRFMSEALHARFALHAKSRVRLAWLKAPVMQARITLTVFGLFCYCHFVIRQDRGFGSPSEPHRLPGWLCA